MMNWIRWEFKHYMSFLRLYRKKKGGTWYYVKPKYDFIYGKYWIERKPLFNEIVLNVERWH